MRTLLTTALLGTSLLAGGLITAPADAAGETCQGEAATIVGTYLQRGLVGTEGRDVVVTNGASELDTLGGDDLVCVTDGQATLSLTLRTGDGDDVVDASQSRARIDAVLGAGADRYTASAGVDSVTTGVNQGVTRTDADVDVVTSTTGGSASQPGDTVSSGAPGVVNSDVVQLAGAGNRLIWSGFLGAGAQVAVGDSAELVPVLGGGDIAIDAAARTWTEDGVPVLSWTGDLTRFTLSGTAPRSLSLTGSERDEYVYSSFGQGVLDRPQVYALGGGDDTLLSPESIGGKASRYDGGLGEDSIDLFGGRRLDVEMNADRMTYRQDGKEVGAFFDGFEAPRLGAKHLYVGGTAHADDIRFYACTATVRGRRGDDALQVYRTGDASYVLDCDARRSRIRIFGEDGKDTITGSRGRDLLVGGRGRDTIQGKANRDRCSGEKLRSCEVRLPAGLPIKVR